jgi:hypothetical protein
MPQQTRRLQQAPDPAEKARAVLVAQVSGVSWRLQRFQERYEVQLTPAERMWLRLACAEVERYLAMLASPGHTRPGEDRARRHRAPHGSHPLAGPKAEAGWGTGGGLPQPNDSPSSPFINGED